MKHLSLVTAKVVRENAQYSYKVVGRGEKYLVQHEEGENAGDKVLEYLAPYAKEPVIIESVALQKSGEIIGDASDAFVYKAKVEFIEVNGDTGKEKKVTRNHFVCANSTREAFDVVADYLSGFISDNSVSALSRTKIIEIL